MNMQQSSLRWALPDLNSALNWCKGRNAQGICCTRDVLGEDIKTDKQIELSVESILDCARSLDNQGLDAAIAIKLTSLGALINKKQAIQNIFKLYYETSNLNINVEDIKKLLDQDITIRLVKGAYMGDTTDFKNILEMYKKCFNLLLESGHYFSVSTHDPEIISWVKEQANGQKDIFEFGFLKGLADETKLELIRDGWQVSEYVPFGRDSNAYVKRRERYLKTLAAVGRTPVR